MFSALDTQMMQTALELAKLGRFSTSPNPRVGCVIAHGAQTSDKVSTSKQAIRTLKFTR